MLVESSPNALVAAPPFKAHGNAKQLQQQQHISSRPSQPITGIRSDIQLCFPASEQSPPQRHVTLPDAFQRGRDEYVGAWRSAVEEELNLR